jgi:hypothetical protein
MLLVRVVKTLSQEPVASETNIWRLHNHAIR